MGTILNSRGIKHPNTFSIVQGNTQYSYDIESINESIRLILESAEGELFGDPNYGSRLHEYLYDYVGTPLEHLIQQEVVRILTLYETRIVIAEDDVIITYDLNTRTVNIHLFYTLQSTDIKWDYQQIVYLNKEDQV